VSDPNGIAPVGPELLVEDLRIDLKDIGAHLERAFSSGDALDVFLLAAGASQILRDCLEDDPAGILRAASVRGTLPRFARSPVARGASLASTALHVARDRAPDRRILASLVDRLDGVIGGLADSVYSSRLHPGARAETQQIVSDAVLRELATAECARLPSCFRSFDQHPRDLQSLARLVLSDGRPIRSDVVVVGVRTSGSYLAPLLAAALRIAGCDQAQWVTIRPRHRPSPMVHARLEALARAGARALVIDDPPTTGGSIGVVATQLESVGFSSERITLTLALLENGRVPDRLGRFGAVVLNWAEWDIHRRLAPDAVRSMLDDLWTDKCDVVDLVPLTVHDHPNARGHAQAGFRATVAARPGGRRSSRTLVAEGTGLGLFGRHVLAVSTALPGLVPDVAGFRDGVAVRQWLAEDARVDLDTETSVRAAVRYVTTRWSALPVRQDASASMAGQQPVWEIASRLLAQPYGIAGLAMRTARLDVAVRSILAPPKPSVIDGQTGGRSWFEDGGSLLKVSFAERAFSNLDLACYDAVYDLAGLALATPTLELADVARAEFEAQTGISVDPERCLLYRLVHLWDLRRLEQVTAYLAEVAMSRVWQEWARARLLPGATDHRRGPWCAIDIDGVLESGRPGASVLTPSAASGLAALIAHGHRVLLATGRSIAELEDRCARYDLGGGVAEYGGIVHDPGSGTSRELIDDDDRAALATCRTYLSKFEGVHLAEGFRTAVRAFQLDAGGSRIRIDAETAAGALRATGGRLKAHDGVGQVDFVPVGVDKVHGVAELLALLGARGDSLAFAVGDSDADLAMLRFADRGFVPSHARHLSGGSVSATKHPYQRGFHDAVTQVLGHPPGGCPSCARGEEVPARAGLLAALLSGLEGGRVRGVVSVPEILWRSRSAGLPATSRVQ
jgi:hydroxymethylpyrimidine pyrophosphatase-like HAD family hydrolase/hypoxanthine phosphoribosyltransferase